MVVMRTGGMLTLLNRIIARSVSAEFALCLARFLPKLGYATIIMNEQVGVKYGLIGILSWLVLTGKD